MLQHNHKVLLLLTRLIGPVLQTLAQPRYNNVHNVTDKDGNTHPISYNIERGTVVGISGDPQRHALLVNINPGSAVGAGKAGQQKETALRQRQLLPQEQKKKKKPEKRPKTEKKKPEKKKEHWRLAYLETC